MLKKPLFLVMLAACAGCATIPPPSDRAVTSGAAIRSAREVGAESVPRASLFLKLAEEAVAKAKVALADGDAEQSNLLLMRAQADAELALALTRETTAEAEAKAMLDQVTALRSKK